MKYVLVVYVMDKLISKLVCEDNKELERAYYIMSNFLPTAKFTIEKVSKQ